MDRLQPTLSRSHRNGLLIDANLLLLLVLGEIDPDFIRKCKRTSDYTREDYELIAQLFASHEGKVVSTPNVLTEVSNLATALDDNRKRRFFEKFAELIPGFDEEYRPSGMASQLQSFVPFGLTDSVIVSQARDRYVVLTDDGRLAAYLRRQGLDVLTLAEIKGIAD